MPAKTNLDFDRHRLGHRGLPGRAGRGRRHRLFVYRHIDAKPTSEKPPRKKFAAARNRFEGQRPLIEIRREGGEPILHREMLGSGKMPEKPLQSLRVLAYDDDSGRPGARQHSVLAAANLSVKEFCRF